MARTCVYFCLLLLTHLNGCTGDVQIHGCSVSDPDCSKIFNAHHEEASIFLDPDATKDSLNHAKESIRSQYPNQINISKCFEEVNNAHWGGNCLKSTNQIIFIRIPFASIKYI